MLFSNKCNRSVRSSDSKEDSKWYYSLCLKAWYTFSNVRWSPSMWANLILASSAAFLASFGRTKHCGTKQWRRGGSPHPTNLVVSTHTALAASASGSLCFNLWELHQVRIFYVTHRQNTNEYAWLWTVFTLHVAVYRTNNKMTNFEQLLEFWQMHNGHKSALECYLEL
jgi:hypothetical protein